MLGKKTFLILVLVLGALSTRQVIINSENFIRNGIINNPELHYVGITRPEEKLLILFRENQNSCNYYRVIEEKVKNIQNGEPQQVKDVIEMIKV